MEFHHHGPPLAFDQFVNLDGDNMFEDSPGMNQTHAFNSSLYSQPTYTFDTMYQLQQNLTPPGDTSFMPPNNNNPAGFWTSLESNQPSNFTTSLAKIDTADTMPSSHLQYGQFTPPTSTASLFQVENREPSLNPEERNQQSRHHVSPIEEADPTSPPKKRTRKNQKKASPRKPKNGVDKRDKFLERNRVAASKCRQKKKEWTAGLDEQARELSAHRDALSSLASSLKEEVLYLKGEMLRHSSCNCPEIKAYLQHQVGKLAGSKCSHCCSKSGSPASTSHLDESRRPSSISTTSEATDLDYSEDFQSIASFEGNIISSPVSPTGSI